MEVILSSDNIRYWHRHISLTFWTPGWFPANPTSCSPNLVHYSDVIMGAIASQITSLSIIRSTVCSGAGQRRHQSSASLAFVRGIHWWLVNSPHKRGRDAENVSVWWRNHEDVQCKQLYPFCVISNVIFQPLWCHGNRLFLCGTLGHFPNYNDVCNQCCLPWRFLVAIHINVYGLVFEIE